MRSVLLATVFLIACNLGGGVEVRDAQDEESEPADEPDGSEGRDAEDDEGEMDAGNPEPGPITIVAQRAEMVVDRLCDLDGDGRGDNALADLAPPGGAVLAGALGASLVAGIERGARWIIHMPSVDDVTGPTDPAAPFFAFGGYDEERCAPPFDPYLEDDFSGEEPYCARLEALDGCGEPLYPPGGASIDRGELRAELSSMAFGLDPSFMFENPKVMGTIAPRGTSANLVFCGYCTARNLGNEVDFDGAEGRSLLETLLAGGNTIGIESLPGLRLDIDLDGDGLEHFELDEDGRIERCVDGDDTVIEGRACWQDERIADALSLTVGVTGPSALFDGRRAGWMDRGCATMHEALNACGDESCLDNVCPENARVFDTLVSCEREVCPTACGFPREDCATCSATACAAELAACLDAPPCCPEPPETSAWDPS